MKNFRQKKTNFYPEGEFNADVENLINCMLCPNMCRFDCGTLVASQNESMSPAYKARIGYYLTMGIIDPADSANKEFINLMYKCTNEENCKIWCPFDFSVVFRIEFLMKFHIMNLPQLPKEIWSIILNHNYERFCVEVSYRLSLRLVKNFGNKWRDKISKTIITRIKKERKIDIKTKDIHDFFQEL